jgi:protocatechuate 3,4-dioxygenase beta subunit
MDLGRCGIYLTAMLLLLSACGGGGGSPGTTGGGGSSSSSSGSGSEPTSTSETGEVVSVGTISLTLLDNGTPNNILTTARPLTAQAKVLDSSGNPVENAAVTFTVGGAFTVLTPASGSVLTSSSGLASVKFAPKDLATAQEQAGAGDFVSAVTVFGSKSTTAKAPYQIGNTAVTLSLVEPSSPSNISAYGTSLVKVNVLANGLVYKDQPVTVNFSSPCAAGGKATLPASGSTVNGQVQVVYTDKGCASTDTISITAAGAPQLTASLNVASPVGSSITFLSATPSDKAIVLKGAGGNGRLETATLKFQALDTSGQPLPNQIIDFVVNSTKTVTLNNTSVTTGSDGIATVTVSSGTEPTSVRVVGKLRGTAIETISDSIAVTTGQPVQAAFSLSVEKFNIPGWETDNVTTSVNILLADQNGNPVADGTPVVFSTDSGAIGSSSVGGCITTNGACSVTFRSQNPRLSSRRATISVSTTSALFTLSGTAEVVLSSRFANPPVGRVAKITTDCQPYTFVMTVADEVGNPLPIDTALAGANVGSNLTVTSVLPAKVLNTLVASTHNVTVTPGNACKFPGGTTTKIDNFDVQVTAPTGEVSLYKFSLTYPAP